MKYLFGLFLVSPFLSLGQSLSDFKNATAFIYSKDSLGNPIPNGTCFIVEKKLKTDPKKVAFFFVTAKHVIQNRDGHLMKEFYIRMNTTDGESRFIYFKTDTTNQQKNIFFHLDRSVDIAVFAFNPQKKDYDYKIIPESFIADWPTFQALKIQEGYEAFFAGLFVPYAGEHKIYPIFRFGHISLITTEKLVWVGEKREMILMEVSSYGGNSGSPVYIKIPQPDGSINVILGGVLSGTFRDAADITVIQTSGTPIALYNNGISGITPAYLLSEILNSPELEKAIL